MSTARYWWLRAARVGGLLLYGVLLLAQLGATLNFSTVTLGIMLQAQVVVISVIFGAVLGIGIEPILRWRGHVGRGIVASRTGAIVSVSLFLYIAASWQGSLPRANGWALAWLIVGIYTLVYWRTSTSFAPRTELADGSRQSRTGPASISRTSID